MISQYNFEVLKERLRGFTDGVLTSVKENTQEHDPFISYDPMMPKLEWALGQMAEVKPREGKENNDQSMVNEEMDREIDDLEAELEKEFQEIG